MSNYENLKQSIKAFEAVASKHSQFGAADTEPDGVFQLCVSRAINAEPVGIPTSARDWDLFTGMDGVEEAAKELTEATRLVVKCIHATFIIDLAKTREFLEDICWRCGI